MLGNQDYHKIVGNILKTVIELFVNPYYVVQNNYIYE